MNELISGLVGERPVVRYVTVIRLSIHQAREELGWAPQIDLPEGIVRTWDWICSLPGIGVES